MFDWPASKNTLAAALADAAIDVMHIAMNIL
jgi:hypothetical protein